MSDIHGNSFALDAVLEDILTQDADITVNLGDILSGGVDPRGARPATKAEVTERLGRHAAGWDLMLCGRTHLQRQMLLPSGTRVVNPGSVGWPAYDDDTPFSHVMEAGTPHARYAIVDDAGGGWNVTFRVIDYDWLAAAARAEENQRDDVAVALRTGRIHVQPATQTLPIQAP